MMNKKQNPNTKITPAHLRILIDPGHGGCDPGAVSLGVRESDINLKIATRLWAMLEESGHYCEMTRICDTIKSLPERVVMDHVGDFDLFISIHANASEDPKACGMEVWTAPDTHDSDAPAESIRNALAIAFGHVTPMRADHTDRDPYKENRFYVLTYTISPAVLVETGFITNDADRAFLLDPENQTDIAAVIAQGIEDWIK